MLFRNSASKASYLDFVPQNVTTTRNSSFCWNWQQLLSDSFVVRLVLFEMGLRTIGIYTRSIHNQKSSQNTHTEVTERGSQRGKYAGMFVVGIIALHLLICNQWLHLFGGILVAVVIIRLTVFPARKGFTDKLA